MTRRRELCLGLMGTLAQTAVPLAQAQEAHSMRLLVGFPPGGLTDLVARIFADKLKTELGRPVFVDNRPGAGARLASIALKTAAPDGRSFVIAPNSVPIHQELLFTRAQLGYDFLADWAPVGTLTTFPFALVVQRSLGVRNAREFADWLRANPRQAFYGSAGAGGQSHFLGSQFGQAVGVEYTHVPYKGNGPLIVDLMGGQLASAALPAADFMKLKDHPKLQVLGLFEEQRSPLVPDIPTLAEQGVRFDVGRAWMAMWTVAGTPRSEIDRVQEALRRILTESAFRQ
jgi:tripartite-type tricarboxylate transporter receptor subunit TctC